MVLKRIVTDDRNLQTIQDAVAQALAKIAGTPFQNGLFVSASLSSGSNAIAHSLGRTPRGWVLTDLTAAATIYRVSWDAKYLTLQSSAQADVSLWVF